MSPVKVSVPPRHLVHIRELDGVRGLAAIMVFFHHVCFTSINPAGWGTTARILRTMSIAGSSGVDLFFVLSGFLITSLLIEARKESSYYRDFYWKRALRILPLYAVCLLGVLLFIPASQNYVILSALFVSNFAWLFHVTSTGPFWTLAIEEQFYLVWPTVVRRRSVAQLKRWAFSIGLGAVILRLFAAAFGHYNYYFTFFHCDGLAFGAFLACWFYRRHTTAITARRETNFIIIGLLLGVGLIVLSHLPGTQIQAMAFLAASEQTGLTLLYGSIVAFLISRTGARSIAVLRSPLLTFFGLISYAMYMTHSYVMFSYDHFRSHLTAGDNLALPCAFLPSSASPSHSAYSAAI
jgi:peptidoglycan/LPS O-acetylase OafA/YrhL